MKLPALFRRQSAPRAQADPTPASTPPSAPHQAGSYGRRLKSWRPFDLGPRREHANLGTLRARSRDACRNNPIARAAVERVVTDVIGMGVSPKPLAGDEQLRTAIIDQWEAWSAECDADGQTDFYGLQTLALRSMLESGEVLALLDPKGDAAGVPLKIRLLESDHLPLRSEVRPNGNRVIDGIELNARGERVAYWLHPNHPGDGGYTNNEPVRVPAARVLHLFEATRPGQLRGVPALASVLVRLKDLDEFDDAQLLRQKIANFFVGFITNPPLDPATVPIGPDNVPLPEDPAQQPPLEFEPGLLQELTAGQRVEFSQPPGTTDGYRDFVRTQLHIVAAALGVPYPILTGDYAEVNDRVVRVAINEYKRRAMALINNVIVPKFCAPVRRAWADAAVLAGTLDAPARQIAATRWTPHGWAYINPVQEVQADVLAINNLLKSRSEAVLARGYDAELIDKEIAADQRRADALGIHTVSTPRRAVTAPQEPAPEPD